MKEKMYYITFFDDYHKNYAIYEVTNITEENKFGFPELVLDLKYRNIEKTDTIAKSVFEKLVKKSKKELILKQYNDGINLFNTNSFFVKICYRYLRRFYPEELL